jgi:plasmid stabilization system protein ParE
MMKIRFLTIAEIEVDEAVSWYQKQSKDQDLNFLDELVRAIRVITTYPLIGAETEPEIRIFFLNRFPYSLIYGIEAEGIVIIALAHQSREPGYWFDRVPFI